MLLVFCTSLIAQNRLLQNKNFEKLELSDRWIVVKYESQMDMAPSARALTSKKASSSKSVLDGMVKIPIRNDQDPVDVCNKYLSDPNVLYAEPIVRDRLLEVPSDPLVGNQYYLENIRAYEAWDISKGDDDIAIAIIDTGVDLDHEDLVNNLWLNINDPIDGIDNDENGYVDDYYGYDFSDDDNDPESDQDSHGARVAGVAGATTDNGTGIAGVGYNTKIAALKGFRSSTGLSNGLFDAILYAVDNGIEILNLSWGGIRQPLQSEQDIINYAVLENDVVVVAAAGNDGNKPTAEEKFYPASYDNVLAVGGSTSDDSKWSGSSYNYAVDLIAPSSGVLSTSNGNSYTSNGGSGTSFASPMVAAAAALVKEHHPTLTAQQIMERVRVTADNVYDIGSNSNFEGKLGRGRLNVFRALSEANIKSLRAENIIVQKSTSDPIFYGDTLTISLELTNYLRPLNDPVIYLSSPENEFNSSFANFFPGAIGTLQKESLTFEIILSEQLAAETNVDVRLDFQDGIYTDFQFIDIETAPDYADFGNENISLPIAGDGRVGVIDYSTGIGPGLIYQNDTILSHAGIILATNEENVSDNIVSNFNTLARDNDFSTNQFYRISHHPFASKYAYSEFNDANHTLLVEQSNITSETGDFIITNYRLVNTGSDTIKNITFGAFADWDLSNYLENYGEYDLLEDYLFTRNGDSTLFAGTKLIGSDSSNYSALDLDEMNGNAQDFGPSFSDAEKYDFLINQTIPTAGEIGAGNDVAGIHGITFDSIPPASFRNVTLIYAAGNSKSQLSNNFQEAENYLAEYLQKPIILETIISCDGGSTIIDPESGEQFIFYEDALGQQIIDTTASFSPTTIDRDTSFYVRNIDLNYPSGIMEIRVQLIQDIADFSLDQDTLYLDDTTTNIVQFSDQSINPISWSWDFGEGTQSTLQNPQISFNQEGTYSINLTVENEFGCIDNVTRNLIVAERPADLTFDEIISCPNDPITIANPTATKLFLYATASQIHPSKSGIEIEIGPFKKDTILYVSGTVDDFRTNRTPVQIDILDVPAEMTISPDTLDEEFSLRAVALVDESSTIIWTVDGNSVGEGEEIVISADPGQHTFELEVTSEAGCTVMVQKTFEVSSSPTPEVTDVIGCDGEEAILKPTNGDFFAFYSDAELSELISKGRQLLVSESSKVFVVNLDDGLPGQAVEANIDLEVFEPEIRFEASVIGGQNKVQFSVESDAVIDSYQWCIDGEKSETSSSPIFFFDDREVEIALEAVSSNGCLNSDTLNLDFTPPIIPLGSDEVLGLEVYPNPTSGFLNISTTQEIDQISIQDVSGKEVLVVENVSETIDLSGLKSGIYILEVFYPSSKLKVKVIRE